MSNLVAWIVIGGGLALVLAVVAAAVVFVRGREGDHWDRREDRPILPGPDEDGFLP